MGQAPAPFIGIFRDGNDKWNSVQLESHPFGLKYLKIETESQPYPSYMLKRIDPEDPCYYVLENEASEVILGKVYILFVYQKYQIEIIHRDSPRYFDLVEVTPRGPFDLTETPDRMCSEKKMIPKGNSMVPIRLEFNVLTDAEIQKETCIDTGGETEKIVQCYYPPTMLIQNRYKTINGVLSVLEDKKLAFTVRGPWLLDTTTGVMTVVGSCFDESICNESMKIRDHEDRSVESKVFKIHPHKFNPLLGGLEGIRIAVVLYKRFHVFVLTEDCRIMNGSLH